MSRIVTSSLTYPYPFPIFSPPEEKKYHHGGTEKRGGKEGR